MKIRYMGKFSGDESTLPAEEHKPGAVMFREADMKRLAILANVVCIVILVVLLVPALLQPWYSMLDPGFFLGAIASLVASIPHEYLHALCFRKTAYIYTNLKQGMLFVTGPEDMSKGRFVFMSLLPSIVFGLIPLILGWQIHNVFLTTLGIFSLTMGAGDYYNVFNALRQMPAGARTYLHGFHSWWYIPAPDTKQ